MSVVNLNTPCYFSKAKHAPTFRYPVSKLRFGDESKTVDTPPEPSIAQAEKPVEQQKRGISGNIRRYFYFGAATLAMAGSLLGSVSLALSAIIPPWHDKPDVKAGAKQEPGKPDVIEIEA